MSFNRFLSCLWRSSPVSRHGLIPLGGSIGVTPRLLSSRISLDELRPSVREFVEFNAKLCNPDHIHVCDGSLEENKELLDGLEKAGRLKKLTKAGYDNCYLATTSKKDVARVEANTYICTEHSEDTVPPTQDGVPSKLGNWMHPAKMDEKLNGKFTDCMKGRTMYVLPFSMGPYGSPLSKIGIQLTDSEYVAASMRIMTRMGKRALDLLGDGEFVKCLHSVGYPLQPGQNDLNWPCNPKNITIAHFPDRNEIKSFGSGYGGNSLLGKKCFALRLASNIARKEGWLAEHMLILSITNPQGVKKYIAAAFPSACGKTNLAMMTPTIPGWKVECVGDDICWMKFDSNGRLRAINPEYGFFGVAPGTSYESNPNAMHCINKDTIFTNVAYTSDGGVYWKGMEGRQSIDSFLNGASVTSWLGEENWQLKSADEREATPAAHPNSRFCAPVANCPIMDSNWEDAAGVPIDAILFGGRRPRTIPLVYEATSWAHGVFVGSTMRSKATSAAEHTSGGIMHDPFAMRPFFGYSFAKYMKHWLSLESQPGAKLPKIFHVNWFRKENDKFLWPGFGENSRVLEWIFRRCENEDIAESSAIGLIPKPGSLNISGLDGVNEKALFHMPKDELLKEVSGIEQYFGEQLPGNVPSEVMDELQAFKDRISQL